MRVGKSGPLKSNPICPQCDAKLDGFTGINNNATPVSDDVTICTYCLEILKFTEAMLLIPLSPLEIDALPKDMLHAVLDAKQAASMFRELREKNNTH